MADFAEWVPAEAAEALQQFAFAHQYERLLRFDGSVLSAVTAASRPASPAVAVASPVADESPVDIALRNAGPSALDTKSSAGHVPRWLWILPLSLLAVGGVAAYLIAREQNRTVAKWMLWTGILLTVLTVATIGPSMKMMGQVTKGTPLAQPVAGSTSAWPASPDGLPQLYVFAAPNDAASTQVLALIAAVSQEYDGKVDIVTYPDVTPGSQSAGFAAQHGVTKAPVIVLVSGSNAEIQRWVTPPTETELRAAMDRAGP